MKRIFHKGELEVQAQAGVSDQAQTFGQSILPKLPVSAVEFLAHLPILLHGGQDECGDVWASVLTGEAGFIRVSSPTDVLIHATHHKGDPLSEQIDGSEAGFLAIDLANRQRFRFNGRLKRVEDILHLRIEQVFANCPNYIQMRELLKHEGHRKTHLSIYDTQLRGVDMKLIQGSDTFFIASVAEGCGADVSHRGGQPGFVSVSHDGTISFKDYHGNNMFQTLGNITADPRAGLLFIDFENGTMLQLTGQAEVQWKRANKKDPEDTGRVVKFRPSRVIRSPQAIGLRWALRESALTNPEEE